MQDANFTLNKLTIIGRVGLPVKVTEYAEGTKKMATVIVATDESYFDKKTDAFKSETEWHKLKFFQPKHVQKCEALMPGSRLYIEARIKTNKWVDENGETQYQTDLIGTSVGILSHNKDVKSNAEEEEVLV